MKKISCWDDLTPFGIEILTAEACGVSFRYLCDVTEKGRKVLSVAFGIPNFTLAEAWNRGTDASPHVGSIMLSQCMLTPIGVFALLESGFTEVWLLKSGELLGIGRGRQRSKKSARGSAPAFATSRSSPETALSSWTWTTGRW